MASLDLFMSRLMVWVPSCPRPLAEQSLLDTAIDFCRETSVVRYTVGPATVAPGSPSYALPLPAQVRLSRILWATYQGRQLPLVDSTPSDGATGAPSQLASVNRTTVEVYPAPAQIDPLALVVHVAVEPTRSATQLPDELLDDWCDAIVAGAVSRISYIPDQPFTNPTVAIEATMRYRQQLNRAKADAGGPRVVSNSRVRPHPLV